MNTNQYQTTHPAGSVLHELRAVIPARRSVTFREALQIAEIQAAKFLQRLDITDFPVPTEAVSELPRIRVHHVDNLPSFGLSFWNGEVWIIQLPAGQPWTRRRFTLLHEYKHIVDHVARDALYRGDTRRTAAEQAELAADYFAGCVLVPRPALKRAWTSGLQHVSELARAFGVSRQAIEVRLDQTGIREPVTRCTPPASGSWRIDPNDLPFQPIARAA